MYEPMIDDPRADLADGTWQDQYDREARWRGEPVPGDDLCGDFPECHADDDKPCPIHGQEA